MKERLQIPYEEEAKWVCLAQRGDEQAVRALLGAHRPLLYAIVRRMNARCDAQEELIQAGTVGLLLAMRRYEPSHKTRFTTYAFPWILGEMKRVLRSQFTERVCDLNGEAAEDRQVDVMEAGRLDLKIAMEKLNEQERLLVILRYYRDKTQAETALLLHKSQSQVSKLERRALDHLRAYLK